MLLVSYIQQYFNASITVLTNQVLKLLIALFKVPNTGALTVPDTENGIVYQLQPALLIHLPTLKFTITFRNVNSKECKYKEIYMHCFNGCVYMD